MPQYPMLRAVPVAVLLVLSVATGSRVDAIEERRPALSDACNAWRVHIGKLIDQHRVAADIDDKALSEIVLQFISARDACSPGQFETGLRMYEAISLGEAARMLQ